MKNPEININGLPIEGVEIVDFDIIKGCFVFVYEDGSEQEIYITNANK